MLEPSSHIGMWSVCVCVKHRSEPLVNWLLSSEQSIFNDKQIVRSKCPRFTRVLITFCLWKQNIFNLYFSTHFFFEILSLSYLVSKICVQCVELATDAQPATFISCWDFSSNECFVFFFWQTTLQKRDEL